jgi:glycopeptide antibiotics resistance protein
MYNGLRMIMPSFFSIGEFNFIPSIIQWIQGSLSIGSWVKHMLIGNIAMFMPLGVLLPFVTEKVSKKIIWMIAIFVPPFHRLHYRLSHRQPR